LEFTEEMLLYPSRGFTAFHYACMLHQHDVIAALNTVKRRQQQNALGTTPVEYFHFIPLPQDLSAFFTPGDPHFREIADFNDILHHLPRDKTIVEIRETNTRAFSLDIQHPMAMDVQQESAFMKRVGDFRHANATRSIETIISILHSKHITDQQKIILLLGHSLSFATKENGQSQSTESLDRYKQYFIVERDRQIAHRLNRHAKDLMDSDDPLSITQITIRTRCVMLSNK
jgi:hypothetical protein